MGFAIGPIDTGETEVEDNFPASEPDGKSVSLRPWGVRFDDLEHKFRVRGVERRLGAHEKIVTGAGVRLAAKDGVTTGVLLTVEIL
jgi:hypothetical protein